MATQSEKDTKEPLKIKKKPRAKNLNKSNDITKVDIHAEKRQIEEDKKPVKVEVKNEEPAKVETKEVNTLEEVVDKPIEKEEVTEVINEKPVENVEPVVDTIEEPVNNLPENVGKLVSFMKETGGTVEDYVTLNKDYNKYDDKLLVKEFYKKTRPHLNEEEINFVMKDNFTYGHLLLMSRRKLWTFSNDTTKNNQPLLVDVVILLTKLKHIFKTILKVSILM